MAKSQTPRTDAERRRIRRTNSLETECVGVEFARGLERELAAVRNELAEIKAAVNETLLENLHLADGDVCTLKRLKDAVGFTMPIV